jgi:hypothetical protein
MRHVMTGLALAATALTGLFVPATTADARSYMYSTQFCAREYDGAMDCSYYTLRQCRLAVSATGGDCAVNPRYSGEPAPRYRRAPRTR